MYIRMREKALIYLHITSTIAGDRTEQQNSSTLKKSLNTRGAREKKNYDEEIFIQENKNET